MTEIKNELRAVIQTYRELSEIERMLFKTLMDLTMITKKGDVLQNAKRRI